MLSNEKDYDIASIMFYDDSEANVTSISQAIKRAVDDGLIEALESPTHNWGIGVQFHPERRGELPPHFDGLFRTLVGKS